MSKKEFKSGDRVHQWELNAPLGRGGSSDVWSARGADGQAIALKILMTGELSKVIRFVREVELMDMIEGRISVPVYEAYLPGCCEPPACYSMPIATSLRTHLEQNPIDAAERVTILSRIGRCLSKLHRRGIFHCDVKPGNIYLLAGYWVFGDFGLAIRKNMRLLAGPDELPGTREYTAPELFGRNLPLDIDWAACDAFSFGKTIWTVMASKRRPVLGPHRRGDPETALKSVVGDYPGIRKLDSLIRRAVAINPEMRPSIAEMTSALDEWNKAYTEKRPGRTGNRRISQLVAAE